jgi:hypothetical protein
MRKTYLALQRYEQQEVKRAPSCYSPRTAGALALGCKLVITLSDSQPCPRKTPQQTIAKTVIEPITDNTAHSSATMFTAAIALNFGL